MTMEDSVSRSGTGGSQHVPRIWLVDYRYLHVNRTEKTFFIFDLLKDNPDWNNKIFIAGEYQVNTGLDFLNENRLYSKPGSGIFYRIL